MYKIAQMMKEKLLNKKLRAEIKEGLIEAGYKSPFTFTKLAFDFELTEEEKKKEDPDFDIPALKKKKEEEHFPKKKESPSDHYKIPYLEKKKNTKEIEFDDIFD